MAIQKVIFTVDSKGALEVSFDPPIAGDNTEEFERMSDDEKRVQNLGGHVAMRVFDAIKTENEEES